MPVIYVLYQTEYGELKTLNQFEMENKWNT